MPPKVKKTKKELIDIAYLIAQQSGIDAITARALGKQLGLSSQAAYTYFESIDLLKKAVVKKIYNTFYEKLTDIPDKTDPLYAIGLNYIEFALSEKQLFRILRSTGKKYGSTWRKIYEEKLIDTLNKFPQYSSLNKSQLENICFRMALFIHGFADTINQDNDELYERQFIYQTVTSTAMALIEFERKNQLSQ